MSTVDRPDGSPKLGLILPEGEKDMGGRTARWADYVEMAQTAEAMGSTHSGSWITCCTARANPASRRRAWECWSVLAGLAAVTQRVELAPLVTSTGYRNPALLAKIADAVDMISGGRLIIALGSGYDDPEFRAFGFPVDHKYARFEEALTIIHTLLRAGSIDFEGTYFSARDCELRPRGPRGKAIPIMIGANGPKMIRLTARYADQWNTWLAMSDSTAASFTPDNDLVDAACLEVGRDSLTLERTASIMIDVDGRRSIPASMGPNRARPLSGTPDEIADGIRAFAAVGVSHLQLYPLPNTVDTLRAFEPVLRALGRA